MPPDRGEKPSIATYADHEVISPPNKLRRVVSVAGPNETQDDPVARAEAALRQLSGEFSTWMKDECEKLDRARQMAKLKGFTKATRDALFHAAHDIKGDAETFGYPLVAPSAESLCRLIEHTPDMARIPISLVDQHVDAVRAIIREHTRPDVVSIATALTLRLREVTDEFLQRENRHRPEYLELILSPPLTPPE